MQKSLYTFHIHLTRALPLPGLYSNHFHSSSRLQHVCWGVQVKNKNCKQIDLWYSAGRTPTPRGSWSLAESLKAAGSSWSTSCPSWRSGRGRAGRCSTPTWWRRPTSSPDTSTIPFSSVERSLTCDSTSSSPPSDRSKFTSSNLAFAGEVSWLRQKSPLLPRLSINPQVLHSEVRWQRSRDGQPFCSPDQRCHPEAGGEVHDILTHSYYFIGWVQQHPWGQAQHWEPQALPWDVAWQAGTIVNFLLGVWKLTAWKLFWDVAWQADTLFGSWKLHCMILWHDQPTSNILGRGYKTSCAELL